MATPRVFLLPKDNTSPESSNLTIVSLPHPRTLVPTRFLLHPKTGLHEITKIAPPATTPRSWLFTNPSKKEEEEEQKGGKGKGTNSKTADWLGNGQIIQDASLYISTPIDPLFILLPYLLPATAVDAPKKAHFLLIDDILDVFTAAADDDVEDAEKLHWEAVLKLGSQSREHIEARIKVVCDTVGIGSEMAYRPNQEKVLALLVEKCESMAKGGLPKSMEDAFVVKPLARPFSEAQSQEEGEKGEVAETDGEEKGNASTTDTTNKESLLPTPPDSQSNTKPDSQSNAQANSQSPASPAVHHLLRIRVSSQFLSASCLPVRLSTLLTAALPSAYDFTPLDTYLSELKRLRFEAASLRSGDFSLKRNHDEDGESAAAAKRLKKEEEEVEKKKKKNVSNVSKGVRDLGKVNTRGMAKMTSFFKKKV